MDIHLMTITQALEKMAAGEFTSVELTQCCLQHIEKVEPSVNAFITLTPERAIEQAAKADEQRRLGNAGPLCGIPLTFKDLLCTENLRTTCGSKILGNFIPPYNATVVDKVYAAGGVLLGKVAMDEFAMGSTSETCSFGVPQNPWKDGYVAGGSSGGSAASIAAGECFASLGSDTGGSIRQPASLCGVVGLKPTYGRVSRYGLVAYASSLDQVGPLCRDVADSALMLQVISGYDKRDSTSMNAEVPEYSKALVDGMKGLRIGVPREYFGEGLDPEVHGVITKGIDALREAGAEVVDISLPHTEFCVAVYYLVATAEASSNLARYDGVHYGYRSADALSLIDMYKESRSQGFGPEVKRRILIGTYALSSGYYDAYYKKASQVRTLIQDDFTKAFSSCDVLISPVTPTPAWKMGEGANDPLYLYLSDILTISANLAGIPGMSVPGGFSSQGLPVGIQLQGPHLREDILLKTAYNLEKSLGIGWKPAPIAC